MRKILCHKTDLKNWTYITNNTFWHPLPAVNFSRVIGKKWSFFTKFKLWATWRTNLRTLVYYIRLVEHSTRNWGSSPLQIFCTGWAKIVSVHMAACVKPGWMIALHGMSTGAVLSYSGWLNWYPAAAAAVCVCGRTAHYVHLLAYAKA